LRATYRRSRFPWRSSSLFGPFRPPEAHLGVTAHLFQDAPLPILSFLPPASIAFLLSQIRVSPRLFGDFQISVWLSESDAVC
jgi:hypothetical protein